jgi:hypothetical protein
MKLLCLISIVLLAVVVQPGGLEQPQELLTKGQVMDCVKAEMKLPELFTLNHERGINFVWSDKYLLALRTAGAKERSFRHCAPPGPSR